MDGWNVIVVPSDSVSLLYAVECTHAGNWRVIKFKGFYSDMAQEELHLHSKALTLCRFESGLY